MSDPLIPNGIPEPMPKAFIWCMESKDAAGRLKCIAFATADNGEMLGRYETTARIYAREIRLWVPITYELVDLIDMTEEELNAHAELNAALEKGTPPE